MEYKAEKGILAELILKTYSHLKKIIAEFTPQNHLKMNIPSSINHFPLLTFVRRQEYSPGILMKKRENIG
jgi:hypothetical protein